MSISISAEEQATFCKKENEKIKVDIEIQKQKTGCKKQNFVSLYRMLTSYSNKLRSQRLDLQDKEED